MMRFDIAVNLKMTLPTNILYRLVDQVFARGNCVYSTHISSFLLFVVENQCKINFCVCNRE